MKLIGVTINNYKSFGETDNFLFLDDLNVIIGKNGAGKSNILEVLSNINVIGLTNKKCFMPKNINNNSKINIELHYKTYENESFTNGFDGDATVILDSYNNYLLSGDLSKFIENSKRYNTILKNIEELKKKYIVFQNQEKEKKFDKLLEELKCAGTKIYCIYSGVYEDIFGFFRDSNEEKYIEMSKYLGQAISFLKGVYTLFPRFIKIKDNMLKAKYNIQEILRDTFLIGFLATCGINRDELIEQIKSLDRIGRESYEKKINAKIKKCFTYRCNKFYSGEHIELKIAIEQDGIKFMVNIGEGEVQYEEISTGFKWYISMLLQILNIKRFNK